MQTVESVIQSKLTAEFEPLHLQVINESGQHNVPPGSESHFKVVLVSKAFDGKRQVQRHQAVYGVLSEELSGGVHALALHTYSPDEWDKDSSVRRSPPCLGGSEEK